MDKPSNETSGKFKQNANGWDIARACHQIFLPIRNNPSCLMQPQCIKQCLTGMEQTISLVGIVLFNICGTLIMQVKRFPEQFMICLRQAASRHFIKALVIYLSFCLHCRKCIILDIKLCSKIILTFNSLSFNILNRLLWFWWIIHFCALCHSRLHEYMCSIRTKTDDLLSLSLKVLHCNRS